MIVGIKTERFITVQRHTNPAKGYQAFGIEERFELHATKGWRFVRRRRQLLGPCEYRDAHRAATQGSSLEFKRIGNANRNNDQRGVHPIPITEEMLMRHAWYRRKLRNERPDAECRA